MQELVKNHDKAYEEMRTFFNGVVKNSLDLITKLKSDLAEAKQQQHVAETRASEVSKENKQLVEPLAQVRKVLAQ